MKAAFLLVLLVAVVAAEEAAPLFTLDTFNNPEALRAIADAQGPTYTLCNSNASYPFTIENLIVQPFPLVKGKPVTMVLVGTAASEITLSEIEVLTKVQSVTINTRSISESGKTLAPGAGRLVVNVTIPSYAPAGNYVIELNIKETSGSSATCMDVPITLS